MDMFHRILPNRVAVLPDAEKLHPRFSDGQQLVAYQNGLEDRRHKGAEGETRRRSAMVQGLPGGGVFIGVNFPAGQSLRLSTAMVAQLMLAFSE
jgi:hypothetical protein